MPRAAADFLCARSAAVLQKAGEQCGALAFLARTDDASASSNTRPEAGASAAAGPSFSGEEERGGEEKEESAFF